MQTQLRKQFPNFNYFFFNHLESNWITDIDYFCNELYSGKYYYIMYSIDEQKYLELLLEDRHGMPIYFRTEEEVIEIINIVKFHLISNSL
jgi:hypothetical protein